MAETKVTAGVKDLNLPGLSPLRVKRSHSSPELLSVKRVKQEGDGQHIQPSVLPKNPPQVILPQQNERLVNLFSEQRKALDTSLGQIVDVMVGSSPKDIKKRMDEWAKEYNTSTSQLQKELQNVQKSQKVLKGAVAMTYDPTQMYSAAKVKSIGELGAYTLKAMAGIDYSTGMAYAYEKAQTPVGQTPPVKPVGQETIGNIAGKYKNTLKVLKGISTIGESATWFAKSHIVGRAESSLVRMREDLRELQGGNDAQVAIWLEDVAERSNQEPSYLKDALSDQGIDLIELQKILGVDELKPEDLQTKEARSAVTKLLSESLKKEIVDLQIFVSLQRDALKTEGISLAMTATKFGVDMAGIVMSAANMTTYIPDFISSTLFVGLATIQYCGAKKSSKRLDEYSSQLREGTFVVDTTISERQQKRKFRTKLSRLRFNEMSVALIPNKGKHRKKIKLDDDMAVQLDSYGISLEKLNSENTKRKGKPLQTVDDLLRPDVKKDILSQLERNVEKDFREGIGLQNFNSMINRLADEKDHSDVSLESVEGELSRYGVDLAKLRKACKPIKLSTLEDLKQREVLFKVIYLMNPVNPVKLHLSKMKKIEENIQGKIESEIDGLVRNLREESENVSFDDVLKDFQEAIKKKYGFTLHLEGVPTDGSIKFKDFIASKKGEVVKQVTGHQQAMNVSTRNALKVVAQKKADAEKPLAKWAVRSAKILIVAGVVGFIGTILSTITLLGIASLGMAATYFGLGVTIGLVVGFVVGMGVLYYYKPHVFKSIFSFNGIRANYAKLRVARRTFDVIQTKHQKKLAAVHVLTEKVNVHLGGVDLVKRFYLEGNDEQKKWAGEKLQRLELIKNGSFDEDAWNEYQKKWETVQYQKIRDQLGTLKLGHRLELGTFGIGSRKTNVGKWLEQTLSKIGEECDANTSTEEIRAKLMEALKTNIEKRDYKFDDSDKAGFEHLFESIHTVDDLKDPKIKALLLTVYSSVILEKEIATQKDKSILFFDNYNTLEKYTKEYNKRVTARAFDDTMNRIAFGSAHASNEKIASDMHDEMMGKIKQYVKTKGKEAPIDDIVKSKLEELGVNIVWLERDLNLHNMGHINSLGDILKEEVSRLILNQCRDRVNLDAKDKEVKKVIERVVKDHAKKQKVKGKEDTLNMELSDDFKNQLAGAGIDIYRVISAMKDEGINVQTVNDLTNPKVIKEISRRFRADWYQLFKEAPNTIAEGFASGNIDPMTAEFLHKNLGIDPSTVATGKSLPEIQKYMAMGGVELDAFLKKRAFVAKVSAPF